MKQNATMPGKNQPLRFLVFSASMRSDSLNSKLAMLAAEYIRSTGAEVDLATMQEFDCPSYNGDDETQGGSPAGAAELNQRIINSDAIIISSPEYNGSMPGVIKNAIDWVSRFRPQPFNEKQILLMSASPSMVGGNRGVLALRIPLEHLGARVFPKMFSLAMAHKAFTPDDKIADATLVQRFHDNISSFMNLVEAQKNYPCMKKAWVEFLGEKPDPLTERAE